eukprot:677197-Pelagomonas_calceolata.AAC.1
MARPEIHDKLTQFQKISRAYLGLRHRLYLPAGVERSLAKSASGASKFISVLDRMSMKPQSKLGGVMSVKERKGLHSCTCLRGQPS